MNSSNTPNKANVMSKQTQSTNQTGNGGVIRVNEFSASDYRMTTPQKKNNRLITYLLKEDDPVYIESPWLRAPFGVTNFEAKSTGSKEWSINISAPSVDDRSEESETINQWFSEWSNLDDFLVEKGVEFQETIFGKGKKSKEVVQALYTTVVKGQDSGYPVRLQPKIQKARDPNDKQKVLDDTPDVIVYEKGSATPTEFENFEELAELVPKNSMVKVILQPKIWCISGKFGLSLRVLQLLVQRRNSSVPSGYAFSDAVDEEQEDSDVEEQEDSDAVEQEDSDAEEVEEASEEEVEEED